MSFGMISHNAFAMGSPPGTCNNEYDGPIVAAQMNLRNQTFDPLFGPHASIELVYGNYYNLAFTIHNPSQNKNGNTLPGEEWTHTDVNGYAQGICNGGAIADQNMTISGSFSGHMSDVSWSTLVSGFSYHVNWVAAGSQDFTPAAWPSHFRIHAGDSASSTISVTSVDKFNGTVSLAASSSPDITTSFGSSSLNVSPGTYASSTLNISTSPTATGQYTITFSASNGTQTQSGVIALTVYPYVPSAPKNISGNPDNGKVFLSWSAPNDDGTSAITNYDIYRGTSSGGETLLGQIGNVLNYTDSTVTNGQTYYYYVKAENSVGQGSASLEYIATPSEAGPFKITTVSVGKYPQSVGVNPVKNLAYVANYNSNTVSVIDGVTGSIINTISTGANPNGVAVNPNTNKIYVTNLSSNTVSVIDGVTNNVIATVPVGQNPYGIAVNPVTNKIYAASISGGLDVIDGNTNSVVSTIPVSVGQEVAVNPVTNKIYAASSANNAVDVIDGTTDSIVSTISVGYTPLGVAVNPNTNMIYVSENPIWNGPNEGIVSVIDGSTNSIVSRISLAGNYEIGVNPNTNMVYLASNDASSTFDDVVYVIDGIKNKVVNIISVGADPYGIGINPNTGKIFVTNEDANTVSVIDSTANPNVTISGVFKTYLWGNIQINGNVQNPIPGIDQTQLLVYAPNGSLVLNNTEPKEFQIGYGISRSEGKGNYTLILTYDNTSAKASLPSWINKDPVFSFIVPSEASDGSVLVSSLVANDLAGEPVSITILDSTNATLANYTVSTLSKGQLTFYINSVTANQIFTKSDNYTLVLTHIPTGVQGKAVMTYTIPSTVTSAPQNLQSTAGNSQVALSWSTPQNNGGSPITSYNVYRGTSSGGETLLTQTGNITSYNDGTVTNGQTYFYTITAVNSAGESPQSNEVSATPIGPPQPPTGLTATGALLKINLSWNAPNNNGGSAITGYVIEKSTDNGNTWSTISANTGTNGTTYSDSNVLPLVTYTYRVSAINSVGTSSPSNTASATTTSSSANGIVLNNVQSTSGTVSSSNQITLGSFNAGTGNNRILVVGVGADNSDAASVTFGGVSLTQRVHSFYNNDAEFWYLKSPTGTGDIVVTMNGPTSAVVGAYSFSGVNQTSPLPTSTSKHNTTPNSPNISLTTKFANDWVLDLPSIYGGSTLGSPTCTQQWNANVPDTITGASSSQIVPTPGLVTCKWTASSGDLWDDVAVEVKASK